jgi:2-polyprenyl-3-methyl-5-hydroxy-6-metoxy-1,4-benzoquinol methylase
MNRAIPISADDYFARPRPQMIPFVPPDARRILDVGCGAGAFGSGLREVWESRNQELEIWGVELDQDAADRAAQQLDRVLCGDAVQVVAGLPAAHFDCVLLNDILEHLVEPQTLLQRLGPLLAPAGRLVTSIPNVRYFDNVRDLVVHGRWDYTDEGILDRTHLRFFTRSTIRRLLETSGYRVETMAGINPTGSLQFRLVNLITLGRWSDMRYLQFACVARFAAAEMER